MRHTTKQTVTLSYDEVKEAVADFIRNQKSGDSDVPALPTCAVVLDGNARHMDFDIEVIWFTGDEDT